MSSFLINTLFSNETAASGLFFEDKINKTFRMTHPIVYFFMRWSMCGESGLFSSLGGAEGGIYSCDMNIAQV